MRYLLGIVLLVAALPVLSVLADQSASDENDELGLIQRASEEVPTRGPAGKATVIKDEQNIVSTELMGTWVVDEELTKRTGGANRESVKSKKVIFRESAESSSLICTKLEALLPKVKSNKGQAVHDLFEESIRSIYLAGEMEYVKPEGSSKHAFALVVWRGNPHIFWHRMSGDEDDFESFNVMLVRDSRGDGDILFIGGDFARERFTTFKREVAEDGEADVPDGESK